MWLLAFSVVGWGRSRTSQMSIARQTLHLDCCLTQKNNREIPRVFAEGVQQFVVATMLMTARNKHDC
jgi:hypothetical protein